MRKYLAKFMQNNHVKIYFRRLDKIFLKSFNNLDYLYVF